MAVFKTPLSRTSCNPPVATPNSKSVFTLRLRRDIIGINRMGRGDELNETGHSSGIISSPLLDLARMRGWYRSKSCVFGVYEHYLFTIEEGLGYKSVFAHVAEIPEDTADRLADEISLRKSEIGVDEVAVDTDGVCLKFNEAFRSIPANRLTAAMDFLIHLLRHHRLLPSDTCERCGTADNLHYYSIKDEGVLYCPTCHRALVESLKTERHTWEREEKQYLRGAVGAAVFSIIGVAAWIALAVLFNRISSAFAFVYVFLAERGYRLFGGKQGRRTPWILLALNALAVFASNYLTLVAFLMLKGNDLSVSLSLQGGDPDLLKTLLDDIFFSTILCLFAWILLAIHLFRQNRQNLPQPAQKIT
jgi:hypothetical protein